ncbi:retrotransposon ORF1 [Tanacetum coccineum]|uniref:Retrotransposon ORF1 n=1 Tax=Tanacetum coccineum TaxID=301880 RepID=A0ABQ5BA29_9ASTR
MVKRDVEIETVGEGVDEIDKWLRLMIEIATKARVDKFALSSRKSVYELGVQLKLLQWHLVNVHIIAVQSEPRLGVSSTYFLYLVTPSSVNEGQTSGPFSTDVVSFFHVFESKTVKQDVVSDGKLKKKTVFPTAAKIEVVKPKQQEKPVRKPVKYAEMYRSQKPRGNQRNWNNQKSHQLGSDFVMNNKACFACGSFNHLIKDCKRKVQKPIWNNARRVNHHNSHRMSYPHPKRNFVPKAVLMKTGMRPVNAAKPKAAYNAVKRNRFNVVKASACWVWMPKNRVVDHVSKNISASVTLKRLDYIDAQGRFKSVMAWMDAQIQGRQECSKEKEESREECNKSRKTKKMKWEDCWELNTSELVLPRDELVLLSQQLVLLEENSSYCSRLQLPVLNQSVNTARITAVGEKVNAD